MPADCLVQVCSISEISETVKAPGNCLASSGSLIKIHTVYEWTGKGFACFWTMQAVIHRDLKPANIMLACLSSKTLLRLCVLLNHAGGYPSWSEACQHDAGWPQNLRPWTQSALPGAMFKANMYRVGQNHIYTVCIRCFWQLDHRMYGVHIRWYTILHNPGIMRSTQFLIASKCHGSLQAFLGRFF